MSHNQASEMSTESSSASETNILSLNFYCRDAIFSSKCLSIEDLCGIAETQSQLKDVVDGVFLKRHKNYWVDLSENNIQFDLANTKRILSNFGAFISELLIHARRYFDDEIFSQCLDWVMEYCGDTLVSLTLLDVNITEDQATKLKPLFEKLQNICLERCDVSSGNTLFNNCESLVELKLGNVNFDDQHSALENTFPKLVRFEYVRWLDGTTDFIDYSIWNDFFSRHKNLKALHLIRRKDGTADLLPMVADHCKQLVELKVLFKRHEDEIKFREALSSILTLLNLNELQIACEGRNITKFIEGLATLKSLQFLTVGWVVGDSEFVAALSKLTQLQSLELADCRGLTNLNPLGELEGLTELTIWSKEDLTFDLVAMIKRLTSLKTLHLYDRSFHLDKQMYQRIVDVLRKTPDSLQNTLQIWCLRARDFVADRQFEKILTITDPERECYF